MKRPFPQSSRLNSQKHYARSASEAKHSWLWNGLEVGYFLANNRGSLIKDISGNNHHAVTSVLVYSTEYVAFKNTIAYTAQASILKASNNIVPIHPIHSTLFWTYSTNADNLSSYGDVNFLYNISTIEIFPQIGNAGINYNLDLFGKVCSYSFSEYTPRNEYTLYAVLREYDRVSVARLFKNKYIYDSGTFYVTPDSNIKYANIAFSVGPPMPLIGLRHYNNVIFDEKRLRKEYSLGPTGWAERKSTKIFSFSVAPPTSQSIVIIPKKRSKLNTRQSIAQGPGDAQYPNLWKGLEFYWAPCVTPKTLTDLSKNKFKLSASEEYSWGNPWRTGSGYSAYGFTSGNHALNIADKYNTKIASVNKNSFSFWVYPFELNSYSYFGIFDSVSTIFALYVRMLTSGTHIIYSDYGFSRIAGKSSGISDLFKLHNFVVTIENVNGTNYNSSTYYNGIKTQNNILTISDASIPSLVKYLVVGNYSGLEKIPVVDARCYSRILSSEEVYQNYLAGPGAPSIAKTKIPISVAGYTPPGPSPTIQTASFTDGAKAGDTLSVMQVISRSFNEGVKVGETWQTISAISKTISEGIKAGESWAFSLVRLANVTEGSVAGDSFSTLQTISRSLNEGVTVTDVLTAVALVNSGLVEGAKASDSFTTNTIKLATILEDAKAGDTFSTLQNMYMTFAEGAKIGDGWLAERLDQFSASFTDGIKAGDAFSALSAIQKSFSEAVVVGESFSVLQTITKLVAEGIKAGDAITPQVTYFKAFTEGILAGDVFAGSFVTGLSLSDGASVGDSWTIQQVISRTLLEGIRAGDTISGIMGDYEIVYTAIKTYAAVLFNSLRIEPSVRFSRIRTDEV